MDSLLLVNYDDSKWLENLGNNKFELRTLPEDLQLGPINDFLVFNDAVKQMFLC